MRLKPMDMESVAGQQFVCTNGNTINLDQPLESTFSVPESTSGNGMWEDLLNYV